MDPGRPGGHGQTALPPAASTVKHGNYKNKLQICNNKIYLVALYRFYPGSSVELDTTDRLQPRDIGLVVWGVLAGPSRGHTREVHISNTE